MAGLAVHTEVDGGVLLHQAGQRRADLALVALLGHLQGHAQGGVGEGCGGQAHHTGRVTQGVAGFGGGQLGNHADVAGGDLGHVGLLLAAHAHQLAHALRLTGAGVDQAAGGRQLAAGHLHIAHLAHEGVGHGLEHQNGGGVARLAGQLHRVAVLIFGCKGLQMGAGQQFFHIVQQHIQRLQVQGAAAEHGGDDAALHADAHAFHDFLGGKGFAAEELLHQGVVGLGHGLAHGFHQAVKPVAHVGQIHLNLLAALILEGLLAEQVHIQQGAVVLLDGHHTGADGGAELDLQVLQNLIEIRILQVHLADEHHAALAIFLGQLVGLFRAHGHARTAGNRNQHALCSGDALVQARLKVKQAGHVDQVELIAVVLHRSHCGGQRSVALCLFGVKIANGGAVFHPAHALQRAGQVEQSFHQRGFAAAAVTGDQDVADVRVCVAHLSYLFPMGALGCPPMSLSNLYKNSTTFSAIFKDIVLKQPRNRRRNFRAMFVHFDKRLRKGTIV